MTPDEIRDSANGTRVWAQNMTDPGARLVACSVADLIDAAAEIVERLDKLLERTEPKKWEGGIR